MSDPVQQPVLVYPNGVNVQPQSQTLQSSHSNKESFGASFIVLAVIIVVSAAACFLSRLCNKSGQKKKHKEVKVMKKGHVVGGGGNTHTFPPEQSRRKEMDMEFGFGAARVGPGPVPGRGFDHHQQGMKGNDFEIGFDKKTRQSKGSTDIEMGFDRRVGNNGSKGAPIQPNAEMMRGQQQQPYHHPSTGVMNGEANRHFNGGRWPGGSQ